MAINKFIFCFGAIVLFVPYGIYAYYTINEEGYVPKALSDENDETYKGKYGYFFKHHFLSINDENNKLWWDSVYEKFLVPKKKEQKLSDEFKNVNKGYEGENSLVNECKKAYEKEESNISAPTGEKSYLKDIWSFCSREVEGIEFLTTSNNTSDNKISDKYGDILVNANENKNELFWEIQETAFFNQKSNEITGNTTFKTFYGNGTKTENKTLREICKEAYEKNADNNEETTHTLKFCSILPNKTTSK